MSSSKLIVFVRNPIAGKVKTRLAKAVGDNEALNIYRMLLRHTKNHVLNVNADKEVSYSEKVEPEDEWAGSSFTKSIQKGQDLGERMKNAFRTGLTLEGFGKVVLIGSDCAELTDTILEEAFDILNNKDVVIGPAVDGGYYLIGMRKFFPEVFDKINWSTSRVFDQTIQRINKYGASYKTLELLRDVDELEDWERVRSELERS